MRGLWGSDMKAAGKALTGCGAAAVLVRVQRAEHLHVWPRQLEVLGFGVWGLDTYMRGEGSSRYCDEIARTLMAGGRR